jgi:hypothetical protein
MATVGCLIVQEQDYWLKYCYWFAGESGAMRILTQEQDYLLKYYYWFEY